MTRPHGSRVDRGPFSLGLRVTWLAGRAAGATRTAAEIGWYTPPRMHDDGQERDLATSVSAAAPAPARSLRELWAETGVVLLICVVPPLLGSIFGSYVRGSFVWNGASAD